MAQFPEDQDFLPPAPVPPNHDPLARPTPITYWRFLRALTGNPLTIFPERYFDDTILAGRYVGRSIMLLHEPALIREMLVSHAADYRLQDLRQTVLSSIVGEGLLTAEGERWARIRRQLMPIFTPRHVDGFAPAMVAVTKAHMDALEARDGEVVPFADDMVDLTLKILMACLFPDDAALDLKTFARNLETAFEGFGRPHALDVLRAPAFVPRWGRGASARALRTIRGAIGALLEDQRARANPGEGRDFMSLLLSVGLADGDPLTDDEIINNLLTFIGAGHETTARSLAWTFYLIARQPNLQDALCAEIETANLEATPPQDWASRLPLTEAVLKESMRLYPAAGSISRSAIRAHRLGDHDMAVGTDVLVLPWVLHRHNALWREPSRFRPARFLEGGEADGLHRFAYLPFGAGPRVCIGARFAMQEMIIIMAHMLSRLRLTHAGAGEPMPVLRITLAPSTEVPMRIERRSPRGG